MKKIVAVILIIVMAFSLCACGKKVESVPATMGLQLLNAFKNEVKDGEKDVQALADALLQSDILPFDGVSMEVVPGWLMGFRADIEGFEKGVMFAPAIGAIPFVAYVFELSDAAECESFCEMLTANADPRWNICTEADETICGSAENLVFFVMCSNEQPE